jgi:hypothetical protein
MLVFSFFYSPFFCVSFLLLSPLFLFGFLLPFFFSASFPPLFLSLFFRLLCVSSLANPNLLGLKCLAVFVESNKPVEINNYYNKNYYHTHRKRYYFTRQKKNTSTQSYRLIISTETDTCAIQLTAKLYSD